MHDENKNRMANTTKSILLSQPSHYRSVTQPRDADDTFLMYLYSVPRVLLYGGAVQASLRC